MVVIAVGNWAKETRYPAYLVRPYASSLELEDDPSGLREDSIHGNMEAKTLRGYKMTNESS